MKETIIIGLLGLSKSGKDTVGQFFVDHGYTRIAFGDILKKEFCEIYDISLEDLMNQGASKEKFRGSLIEYAEKKRLEDPYYWINKAIKPHLDEGGNIKEGLRLVFTDIRRDREIDWFEDLKALQYHTARFDKVHYITAKLFNIIRPDNIDPDNLTHETIGYAKGMHKNSPFPIIDAYIENNSTLEVLNNKVTRIIETYSF